MPRSNDFPKGLELVFADANDNIRFTKQQEWTITRNALTAYAALFTVANVIEAARDRVLLIIAVWLVFAFNALVLFSLKESLETFRARIKWIYEKRFEQEQEAGLPVGAPKDFFNTNGYIWCLVGVSLVGAAIATLAIGRV